MKRIKSKFTILNRNVSESIGYIIENALNIWRDQNIKNQIVFHKISQTKCLKWNQK